MKSTYYSIAPFYYGFNVLGRDINLRQCSIVRFIQLSIILSALLFINACTQKQAQSPAPLVAVIVTTANQQTIKPTTEFVGRAESTDDIKIRSRVGGVLVKRFFKQGQDVKKGALLFEIDQAPFKAALLEKQARLDKATSDHSIAARNFKRGKALVGKGVISELDMDKLTNQLEGASSSIRQAQAGLDTANLNFSYTRIKAPLDGRVGKSIFAIGDVINPSSDTLTTLVKMDPMWVSFQISETDMVSFSQAVLDRKQAAALDRKNAAALGKKQTATADVPSIRVELRLSNGTMYSERGIIDYLSNRIDPATGTMNLRATFKNSDNLLLPGQYMDVIILSNKELSAILIPQSAVQEDQQGRFVMTVGDDNKVAQTRVKMGDRYGIEWEVVSGLQAGDRVIVEGLQKVRAGIEVSSTEREVKPFESSEKIAEKM